MKVKVILRDTERKKKGFHSNVMQNTSTVGKEHFGLSDRKKIKGRVDVDKLKALINEGLSFSEVARKMGFERMTLKGFCEREGISTKRGK